MNTNKLVSIIIPVYNAEKYIFKCLKSVLNQTYTNIEVIIIDDQSTDKSLEICTKLQKEDSRIKIYMQSHSGVVVARKKGIINSSGEYICFVDADDFVKNTLIENLLNEMRKCDIVCAGVLKEDKYGNTIAKMNDILKGVYNDEKQLKYIEDNMIYVNNVKKDGILPYMVAKMYKSTIAKNIVSILPEDIYIYEDRLFNWIYLLNSKGGVSIIEDKQYIYRYNKKSVMNTNDDYFMMNLNKVYIAARNYFEIKNVSKLVIDKLQKFIINRLYIAPRYMRFSWQNRIIQFYSPLRINKNEKIVLYGAGEVGIDYYRQLCAEVGKKHIKWTDKKWYEINNRIEEVISMNSAFESNYDKVLIAVKEEIIANQIKQELIEFGVEEDKILWEMPIILKNL